MRTANIIYSSLMLLACGGLSACYPTPGPDKTAVGAVLGAGWGAGAGAIVGNQVHHPGDGVGIGAALGAASGLMTGVGLDIAEGGELEQQRDLDALKTQVAMNQRALLSIQGTLDDRGRRINAASINDVIYFDANRASLRLGSAEQLERFAAAVRRHPFVKSVEIHGHTDDLGNAEKNQKLAESRAKTVMTFLANQGISTDIMTLESHGAEQPLASNSTDEGKQLNRRVEVVVVP